MFCSVPLQKLDSLLRECDVIITPWLRGVFVLQAQRNRQRLRQHRLQQHGWKEHGHVTCARPTGSPQHQHPKPLMIKAQLVLYLKQINSSINCGDSWSEFIRAAVRCLIEATRVLRSADSLLWQPQTEVKLCRFLIEALMLIKCSIILTFIWVNKLRNDRERQRICDSCLQSFRPQLNTQTCEFQTSSSQ